MGASRLLTATAVVAGVLALAGCTAAGPSRSDAPHDAPSGGQTLGEMRELLGSIDGIRVSDIRGGERPNVKGNTGYSIALDVSDGYTVIDGAALVDFVVTAVWSVREGYRPNATIDIRVRMPEGGAFDVAAAAASAGWVADASTGASAFSTVTVPLSAAKEQGASNLTRLGDWPGAVPAIPTDVTARG
ncbi:hypothetical protein [Microbacterium soli]|uniref:DUF4825 domain-containing protein n=1 Tax=Microbacterium soli TaxID=446075 RepID=A0ABP7N5U4_9MICO